MIHPIAGLALAHAAEADALQFEFGIEPTGEVDALGDYIAPEDRGGLVVDVGGRGIGLRKPLARKR